jgi:hypothetical protein
LWGVIYLLLELVMAHEDKLVFYLSSCPEYINYSYR